LFILTLPELSSLLPNQRCFPLHPPHKQRNQARYRCGAMQCTACVSVTSRRFASQQFPS
jgi:hypothetical protein